MAARSKDKDDNDDDVVRVARVLVGLVTPGRVRDVSIPVPGRFGLVVSNAPAAPPPAPLGWHNMFDSEGRKHGQWFVFYPNGHVRVECTYEHGKLHGQWRELSLDGYPVLECGYEHGKRHGPLTTRNQYGRLVVECTYEHDKTVEKPAAGAEDSTYEHGNEVEDRMKVPRPGPEFTLSVGCDPVNILFARSREVFTPARSVSFVGGALIVVGDTPSIYVPDHHCDVEGVMIEVPGHKDGKLVSYSQCVGVQGLKRGVYSVVKVFTGGDGPAPFAAVLRDGVFVGVTPTGERALRLVSL